MVFEYMPYGDLAQLLRSANSNFSKKPSPFQFNQVKLFIKVTSTLSDIYKIGRVLWLQTGRPAFDSVADRQRNGLPFISAFRSPGSGLSKLLGGSRTDRQNLRLWNES